MTRTSALSRLQDHIATGNSYSLSKEILIGASAALVAVAIRYALPLRPDQLPTAIVVIVLALVTTFVGLRAGIVTAAVGGLASWYLFFNPQSWTLSNQAWIPLLGYVSIAAVILTTSQLYRTSERQSHSRQIARLEADAETSRLFARELAHRLGNMLAIVQSIAVQTIGRDNSESENFVGRLRALAAANQLLTEHVKTPTARVREVVDTALKPFADSGQAFRVESVDAVITSQQVLSLALALHELSTNAVKYGALSSGAGFVSLTVTRTDDGLLLSWKEQGGPPVRAPERQGFGTRLLERSGMQTRLDFESDGLRCAMTLPASA